VTRGAKAFLAVLLSAAVLVPLLLLAGGWLVFRKVSSLPDVPPVGPVPGAIEKGALLFGSEGAAETCFGASGYAATERYFARGDVRAADSLGEVLRAGGRARAAREAKSEALRACVDGSSRTLDDGDKVIVVGHKLMLIGGRTAYKIEVPNPNGTKVWGWVGAARVFVSEENRRKAGLGG